MRILMVNKFLYPRGGAETYFLKIGSYLEKAGHEVEYFGMFDEQNTVTNSADVYTYNMDFHKSGIKRFLYPIRIIYSFEARRKIREIIKKFKPDIVHLNNINFQLTPSIIEEIHKHKITMIQTVHDYQMICPNHLMFDNNKRPCELCVNGSKWNCAKKNCIHGSKIKSILGSIEAILYKHRKTYQLVDLYICPSRFIESKLNQLNLYHGRTLPIHNFIELKKVDESSQKHDYVLYFGRLSEEKGIEMFINSCKRLSHIKFIIAGSGPLESICKDIPNVEFVGFKTGEELNTLISNALFSVYPSIWYENCPLSILESESLGTPVIASKMGGIPELIENDQTGILIDNINEDNLAEEIDKLYQDREKMLMMSKNCLDKRQRMISLENYGDRLIDIYNQYLKKALL
ncbi:MAG: glycosyltransferase [Anaerolineaceae bacterium]|nr:MAG: glycosyltransferase [Anaerolineaceae bacterium]